MFTMTKLAAGTVAGVLSVALTGAVAFAAFQPAEGVATAATVGQPAQERGTERPEGKGQVRALAAIGDDTVTAVTNITGTSLQIVTFRHTEPWVRAVLTVTGSPSTGAVISVVIVAAKRSIARSISGVTR